MKPATKGFLLRAALGVIATAAIIAAIKTFVDPIASQLEIEIAGKPVQFLQPKWFYLVAVIPLFWVVRAFSLTDVSLVQQYISTVFRSLLVAGVAVAMARPVWTTTDDKIATVVLVDVSDSVSDKQLEAARVYAESFKKAKREQDKVYVVSFAERPRLIREDKGHKIERHPGEGAGTNIQSAIQLGYGLYPDGYLPRMVVVSDGNQTRGDMLVESYRADELGVRVSWKTFPEDRSKEIRIASIKVPDEVKVGAPFEVKAEILSTHEEEVTLSLRQDEFPNPLEPRKKVTLHEGMNLVSFKSEAKRAGFTTYEMKLVNPTGDKEKQNNVAVMTAPVQGRPHILYIEGGVLQNPGVAGHFERALEHENMDVEVRGPRGLPSTAKELEKYDLVVVSDVPAHFMGMGQMSALESYVRDLGGGLIMSGGEDSFGSGGYSNTRIEKIMPVRFDTERDLEQPNVAIALVVDRSGSMSGPKLEAAKEAARATAEVLNPSDLIAVVAFDSSPMTIVRMQRASNRLRISTDIAKLTSGGGTNIEPALREAYELLQPANAKVKHVIVLSDGQAPYDGIADLVQEMNSARITVSAVGIGDADRNLLQLITENGEGRLYMVEDIGALPRIFMQETTEAQKSALVEESVGVHVKKNVECIEGTGVGSAPNLRGYVTTQAKPTSEVILVSDLGEPILARWRLGTGSSVAWTSDIKNRWAVDWIRWGNFPKFWAQVVRCSMRSKVYDSYDLFATVTDGKAQVVVDAVDVDDKFVNNLETSLEVIDPRDSKTKRVIPMEQSAAGRYTAEFEMARYGSYMLKAVHKREGRVVAESLGSASLPYPEEYLRSTPDEEPLRHAAMVTGGVDQATPQAVFKATGESIKYTQDLWPWVLLFVAAAFVLDVYLKRLRIFGYRTIKF